MRDFCKPLTPEQQKEIRNIISKHKDRSIELFNKKYTDKGLTPPLWETHFDKKENCATRIYPDGRMEITFRHALKFIKEQT